MSDGYFTPEEAAEIVQALHVRGKLNIRTRMHHATPGQIYQGDNERKAGRTAEISIDLTDVSLDSLISIRDEVRALGYDSEMENSTTLNIMGKWKAQA